MEEKTMKRTKALICMVFALTVLLTLVLMPANVFAAEGIIGGGETWELSNDGTLTINDTGYLQLKPWSQYGESIKKIVVSDEVTTFKQGIFEECVNVESITVPCLGGSVSDYYLGWFFGGTCAANNRYEVPKSLKEVTLTNEKKLGWDAFDGCYYIETINLNEGPTQITPQAFRECRNLKDFELPSTVTSVDRSAFEGCSALTELDLTNVQYLGVNALLNCTSLESVSLSEDIYYIGTGAFMGCSSLKNISIPEGIEEISHSAFSGCSKLETISLPTSLKEIDKNAFYNCTSLFRVDYMGSESMWDDVRIDGDGNDAVKNAEITFGMMDILPEEPDTPEVTLDVPVLTAKASTTSGKPYLSWTAVDGAEKYEVYRATSKTGEFTRYYETTKCNYTNTGAIAGRAYYYKVRAICGGVAGEFSEVKGVTCDLKRPTNLGAETVASTGSIKITWDAVDGADKYYVYRSTTESGTYSFLCSTTKTSCTNSSVEPGKKYYYKLRSVDADNSNANSAQTPAVSAIADCARPTVTIKTSTSSGKPYLSWDAVKGASKYEIHRATSKEGAFTKLYTTTKTTYTNTGAAAGRTYYYKVVAVCEKTINGNSAFSAVKSITCDCARPVVTIKLSATSGKPYLKWDAVTGASKYEVYRSTSSGGSYTKIYTTSKTSFTNTGASKGKTYYYKVVALCDRSSYGNSAYSAVKSIKSK